MKAKVFINGIAGISAQSGISVFEGEVKRYTTSIFPAVYPDFKEYIPASALRRMATGNKMGLTAAIMALKDAGVDVPEAIITGTGEGCKQDTEKFLQQILKQNEEMLAPTAFIQSTHNTIGGQIALNLQCTGYNMTYSHNSASLESAFIDAQLQLLEDPYKGSFLVGGIDEISEKITGFKTLDGQLKQDPIQNLDLLGSESSGTITSEGAHFFTLSAENTPGSYAELLDINVFHAGTTAEVSEQIQKFLQNKQLEVKDLDIVILGNNGDCRFDHFYQNLQANEFKAVTQLAFKPLVGEFDTVTGYAVWLACYIFKLKTIPEILKQNSLSPTRFKRILIYNQYLGENHSLILLGSA